MSELKEYIDSYLDRDYDNIGVISETAINRITLYEHREQPKKLLLIKSHNRNDEVFRILKGIDTGTTLPGIYEVCSDEDALYVLEEHIDGVLLSEIDKPAPDKLKKCITDVCDALRLLHSQGIVHRDIKPANVIVRPDGSACLIDLSIAKLTKDNDAGDTMNLGTIGYAAPEQFGFSSSQPTTDIYAMGVMMNELILGVHPSISIPRGRIGRIIKKCTNTQVSRRYQSIDELITALSHTKAL